MREVALLLASSTALPRQGNEKSMVGPVPKDSKLSYPLEYFSALPPPPPCASVTPDTNPKASAMVQNLPVPLAPGGTPLVAPHSHRGEAPARAVTPLRGSRQ